MLGIGKTAKGYDLGYACENSHERINIWSRKKPIQLDKWGQLTDIDFKNSNFGLEIPIGNEDAFEAAKGEYTYLHPTGSKWQCRLTDFEGYYHEATPPVMGVGDYTVNKLITNEYTFSLAMEMTGSNYVIGLNEVNKALGECYLAFAIQYTRSNMKYVVYKTTNDKIKDLDNSGITFDLTRDPPFNYTLTSAKYAWVAAAVKYTDMSQSPPAQLFAALPFKEAGESMGNIAITSSTNLVWEVVGIANSIITAMSDINSYESGATSNYFKLQNGSGDFYLEVELANYGSTATSININTTNIKGVMTPTFANVVNQSAGTGNVNLLAYKRVSATSYQKVTGSLSIPGNSKVYVRFGVSQWLAYYNNSVYSIERYIKKEFCSGVIYYNGSNVASTIPFNIEAP